MGDPRGNGKNSLMGEGCNNWGPWKNATFLVKFFIFPTLSIFPFFSQKYIFSKFSFFYWARMHFNPLTTASLSFLTLTRLFFCKNIPPGLTFMQSLSDNWLIGDRRNNRGWGGGIFYRNCNRGSPIIRHMRVCLQCKKVFRLCIELHQMHCIL